MRKLAAPALLLCLAALGQEAPDPFLMERVLPPGALLYLAVPQSARLSEDYRQSHLARFLENEEIRPFADSLLKWWKRRKNDGVRGEPSWNELLRQMWGLSIDELWDLLGGPLSLAVYDLPFNEEHKLDLVLSLGSPDAKKLSGAVAKLKAAAKQQGANLAEGEFKHQGTTVHEVALDDFKLYHALVGNTLVVTTDQERIETIISAFGDQEFAGLREDPAFKGARARVAAENRHFLLMHLNLSGVLKKFRKEVGDETLGVLETLGLRDIASVAASVGYDGPYVRERYALLTSRQDRGILKFLAGGTPADPSAKWVPSGALAYSHFGLNLAELYDVVRAAAKVSPGFEEQFARGLKEYEDRLGVGLRQVFETVGASWTAYSAFPAAGGSYPDSLYVVSLKDPAAFEAALERIARDAKFPVEETTFRGQKIRWVTIGFDPGGAPDPDLGVNLQFGYPVAYFIKDGFLFAASDLLSLKRQVLRFAAPAAPIDRDPRFQAIASRIPRGEWESWSYMDFGRLVNILYSSLEPFAHPFRDMARDETGDLVVDLARLPLGESLADLLGPTLTHKRTLPDAILVDSYSHTAVGSTSGVVVVAIAGAIAIPLFLGGGEPQGPASNERVAQLTLGFIRQAQETFKNSDSDRNGAADYWTRDVAGLYGLKDRSGQVIFLIEEDMAKADPDGTERYGLPHAARQGYYYKMMSVDPAGDAYQRDEDKDGKNYTNKARYGVAAYPAEYGASGRFTFIVNEEGRIFKKDTAGQAVQRWPGKDPLKEGWQAAD